VHLKPDEAKELLTIADYNWRAVDPTIFGSLIEGFLSTDRSALGAHYTHEVDILKIVRPTIVKPWRQRIDAVTTPDEGVVLLNELCRFRVLDPACGGEVGALEEVLPGGLQIPDGSAEHPGEVVAADRHRGSAAGTLRTLDRLFDVDESFGDFAQSVLAGGLLGRAVKIRHVLSFRGERPHPTTPADMTEPC
jgi:hypothetical protein